MSPTSTGRDCVERRITNGTPYLLCKLSRRARKLQHQHLPQRLAKQSFSGICTSLGCHPEAKSQNLSTWQYRVYPLFNTKKTQILINKTGVNVRKPKSLLFALWINLVVAMVDYSLLLDMKSEALRIETVIFMEINVHIQCSVMIGVPHMVGRSRDAMIFHSRIPTHATTRFHFLVLSDSEIFVKNPHAEKSSIVFLSISS